MRTKIHIFAFVVVLASLFAGENANATGRNMPGFDSACCAPDSLIVTSTDYPIFCLGWQVRVDSTCGRPKGFEVQWKLLTATVWQSQTIAYISGSTMHFCDSVDTCGAYQVRVRTKCNDSLYSGWVYSKKFVMPCDSLGRRQLLTISPNPASTSINIAAKNIRPGPVKIWVVDVVGRNVVSKTVYIRRSEQLTEMLLTGSWPKGLYFISIMSDGAVIRRGSFLKE